MAPRVLEISLSPRYGEEDVERFREMMGSGGQVFGMSSHFHPVLCREDASLLLET